MTPVRESEAVRQIFLLSPVMMCTFDWEGHYTMVNPHFSRSLGYRDDELVGRHYLELVHPDDIEATVVKDRELHESETTVWNYEVRMRCKNGDYRTQWWDVSSSPREHMFFGVGRDVTEARRAEREMAERRDEVAHRLRLQTVGEMATEIAHELNQPLTAIDNYARGALARLRRGEADPRELAEVMERVSEQALRAGDLIRRVRSFARRASVTAEPCDLNELVRSAVALLTTGARATAKLTLALDPALPVLRGDAIQLEQVVMNLVHNGMDALLEIDEPSLEIRTARAGRREVRLEIVDNGHGVPDEVRERIFDPFYTTKARGLGLGLAISRSIVEAHGGRIWAESAPGSGATFVVELPVDRAAA